MVTDELSLLTHDMKSGTSEESWFLQVSQRDKSLKSEDAILGQKYSRKLRHSRKSDKWSSMFLRTIPAWFKEYY